jgi:RNA polymerase sigma factor (sigma-70 family)
VDWVATGGRIRGFVLTGRSTVGRARRVGLASPLFDSLYNFARWLVHNQSDGEDLVQETYLKALRSFASFQLGTNFRAWIFQFLRNTFLSSSSRLERRMTIAMDLEEDFLVLPATSTTCPTIRGHERSVHRSGIHFRKRQASA